MKKVIFFAMVFFASFFSMQANAQDYPQSNFGVDVGVNFSKFSVEGASLNSRPGFYIAGTYEHLLLKNLPLYLETGVQFSQKRSQLDILQLDILIATATISGFYAEVPVMLNYKFFLPYELIVYPCIGAYYGFGIGGQMKSSVLGFEEEKTSLFGEEGFLSRSDFGLRAGCAAEWNRLALGLNYEYGLLNVSPEQKTVISSFLISVGVKF